MSRRTHNEIVKNASLSYANSWVFIRRKSDRSGRLGLNEVDLIDTYESKIPRRQEGRERVVEVIYAHGIGRGSRKWAFWACSHKINAEI
jgi:hypothetical protein